LLPASRAELENFSDRFGGLQPGGTVSKREWIHINRADADEYEKDLELFQTSLDFMKASRTR